MVERPIRRSRSSQWQSLAITAGALGLALLVGVLIVNSARQPQVVEKPGSKSPGQAVAKNNGAAPQPRDHMVPDLAPQPAPLPGPLVVAPKTPASEPPQIASNHTPPTVPQPAPVPQPKYLDPAPSREVISFVNASLTHGWTENGVVPSPLATDAEWCRRLFVRIIGRIPTAEELKAFTSDRASNRRNCSSIAC